MLAIFETATLADAVARAARIAPAKGAAWDKAAGIVLDHDAGKAVFRVRATDLEATFIQYVAILESSDDTDVTWRLPSALLTGVLSGLPLGHGCTVTITDNTPDGTIKIQAGKTRAKLRPILGTFPVFAPFSMAELQPVTDFGMRLEQVAWCVDPAVSAPLCGVHMDGESMIVCDRFRVVKVPCVIPVAEPITAPLSVLTDLLRNAEEVSLAAQNNRLLLSPDRDTQATTTIFLDKYPDVLRIMRDDFANTMRVHRSSFEAAISRMMVMVKGDRYPTLRMGLSNGVMAFVMQDADAGRMEDEIEVEGGPDELFVLRFTPQHLLGAATGSGAEYFKFLFGPRTDKTVSIQAGDYRADVMPKDPTR